jgi:signal transduction histidine kinase
VWRWITAALATVGVSVGLAAPGHHEPYDAITQAFIFFTAGVAGLLTRARRGTLAAAESRAARAEAELDVQTARAAARERATIARELHDVVAHTMATINVQAGVAVHVLTDRPDAAAEALQTIKTASKEGLRELRAILNVLRQADEADPTQPAPGLAQLPALIHGAGRAGLATTLSVTGPERPLTAAVDLAAYRIIQESLTNAIRHAGPATATVTLAYDENELRVEVADTGRGLAPTAGAQETGHGLTGMRERAASVGGTVHAGPSPAVGYRVAARLPTGRPPATGGARGARGASEARMAQDASATRDTDAPAAEAERTPS